MFASVCVPCTIHTHTYTRVCITSHPLTAPGDYLTERLYYTGIVGQAICIRWYCIVYTPHKVMLYALYFSVAVCAGLVTAADNVDEPGLN